jgi:hypothetical protein
LLNQLAFNFLIPRQPQVIETFATTVYARRL